MNATSFDNLNDFSYVELLDSIDKFKEFIVSKILSYDKHNFNSLSRNYFDKVSFDTTLNSLHYSYNLFIDKIFKEFLYYAKTNECFEWNLKIIDNEMDRSIIGSQYTKIIINEKEKEILLDTIFDKNPTIEYDYKTKIENFRNLSYCHQLSIYNFIDKVYFTKYFKK